MIGFLASGIKIMAAALRALINKRCVSPLSGPSPPSAEGKKNKAAIKHRRHKRPWIWRSLHSHGHFMHPTYHSLQASGQSLAKKSSKEYALIEHYAYLFPVLTSFMSNTS